MQRKHYSVDLKLKIIQEAIETGNSAVVARRYDISSSLVNRWTRNYRKYGEAAFKGNNVKTKGSNNALAKEYQQASTENEKLKKILGEKELEIEILKDLLKKTNPHLQIK